jgi:hypothetical protein
MKIHKFHIETSENKRFIILLPPVYARLKVSIPGKDHLISYIDWLESYLFNQSNTGRECLVIPQARGEEYEPTIMEFEGDITKIGHTTEEVDEYDY